MQESLKKQIEAILFTLGKFVAPEELAKYLEPASVQEIKKTLEQLKKEYEEKDSALILHQQDNLFKLNIKKEFGFLTNKLLSDTEMDSPTTKTLAIIAWKSPVTQSEIIRLRGNKAYDHISHLKDSALISTEKYGRTRMVKLTPHFYDYFDISEKELKKELSKFDQKDIQKVLSELPNPFIIEETQQNLKIPEDK